MFNSKSKTARKEVEAIFNEIQINLENNYMISKMRLVGICYKGGQTLA